MPETTGPEGHGLQLLQGLLTEENTDLLIDLIFDELKLPFWFPTPLAKRLLDQLLPDVLLSSLTRLALHQAAAGT